MKRRAETDKLESRLLSLGRSIQSQFTKRGLGSITFGILFGLYALFIIDYLTDIPYIIRIAATVIGLIYAFYYFNKHYLKKARVQLSAEEVSLRVEDHNPTLQSRLISLLQFQAVKKLPAGVSENLVDGMCDQAIDQVNDIRIADIIDHSWIKKHFKRITIIALIIGATVALAPNYALAFAMRFVNPSAEYPTRTQIVDLSIDKMIPAGDPFQIIVKAEGELPELGNVSIYTDEAGRVEFELVKGENEGEYIANIAPINVDAELTVYLGDDTIGPRTVTPTPRPFIKALNAIIVSPSYTGIEKRTEQNGNIRAFQGSNISIQIESSKKLAKIDISSRTKDFELPQPNSDDGVNWTLDVEATQSFSYQISMTDEDGLESAESANYQVSIMRDRPPVIRILAPKSSTELAPVSKLPLNFKVNDDIGVDRVAIKYNIIGADNTDDSVDIDYENAKTMMEFSNVDNKVFEFSDLWDNTKISLRTGDTINFWIEAQDNAPAGHTQRSSDRQIMIISIQDYRNKLLQKLSENVEQVDEPIIDLKDSARKLND